jgi:DNA-binding PadR family transcriptional regulator
MMCAMVRRPPGIELALLGFLQAGSQHGYQIHQMFLDQEGLGQVWHLKQSQLYALLGKLEKDGYIWGKLEHQEGGRPPRRLFELTDAGKVVFREWLLSPVNSPRLLGQEFMAKWYFVRQESAELARRLLLAQRAICESWLARMQTESEACSGYQETLQQYRLGQVRACLAWLENMLVDG